MSDSSAGSGPASHDGASANPFATPPADRDPVRRARGRLVAPVTIVTAGSGPDRAGLTVSSLMIAEGEPAIVYFLVGSTSDLYDALVATDRFVVHVCTARDRELADVFAGLRPAPGGPFAGRDVTSGPHGPVFADLTTRVFCTVESLREESYSVLVAGSVDEIDNGDLAKPLAYFRGRYRELG